MSTEVERLNAALADRYRIERELGRGGMAPVRLADHLEPVTPSERTIDEPLRRRSPGAPYMHDGSMPALEDVIDFYDGGGVANPNFDREIRPLHLTADEKSQLAAYLRSLTGTTSPDSD